MSPIHPIALAAYEELAERYSAVAESKAENGFIEHPAMRAQLGDVYGLMVLDAGCGPGFLTTYLLNAGADVTAFDISPKMIELARKRSGEKARFFLADMACPLPQLKDGEFDLVASSLAIDYVRDWSVPLGEFQRVLKPRGRLVISVQHPLGAYLWYNPPSAFGVHLCEATWQGFGGDPVVVPDYYRSFEEIINPIINAGFAVHKIIETKPIDRLRDVDPIRYEKYRKSPTFMIIEANKSG